MLLLCRQMSDNRNKCKQYFITFPQSGKVTKKEFVDSLPPVEAGFAVTEEHEDGGMHIHALVKLRNGITKANLLKYIIKKWPDDYKRIDIQITKNLNKAQVYLQKEDPDPYVIKDDSARERMEAKLAELEAKYQRPEPSYEERSALHGAWIYNQLTGRRLQKLQYLIGRDFTPQAAEEFLQAIEAEEEDRNRSVQCPDWVDDSDIQPEEKAE